MKNKYDNLVKEINKQEEIMEEKNTLGDELQLLQKAISNLQDCVKKVEKEEKDTVDKVKPLKAAKDSMDTADQDS